LNEYNAKDDYIETKSFWNGIDIKNSFDSPESDNFWTYFASLWWSAFKSSWNGIYRIKHWFESLKAADALSSIASIN
jgi:hypothetical protein